MALADTARLIASLELQDRFSGPARNATRALTGLEDRTSTLGRVGLEVNRGLSATAANLQRIGLVGGGLAVGGIVAATRAAIDFEDAFAGIRKTVDETELAAAGLTFDSLSDSIRAMARVIPLAATELAAIGEAAGALGIRAQDIEEFTRTVAELSFTTDLTSDTAATALGQLGTILDLTGEEFRTFGDSLVALGNAGASTESQIIDITTRFAAAGRSAGLTVQEILALSSAVASMGIEAEAGGSALSRVFNNVSTGIGTSSAKAAAFADTLGLSAAEFRAAWERDALGTFQDFLDQLNELDQFEAADLLQKVGITNIRDVNTVRLMAQNIDDVNSALEVSRTATGALGTEAAQRIATTASQIEILKNNLTDVGITIGSAVLPKITEFGTALTNALNSPEGQRAIQDFAAGIPAVIDDLVGIARSVPWEAIGSALQLAGAGARVVLDVFKSMPPWVQTAVLTGWGLNKLTGGALGGIIGELGAGLVKGVLGMNAGVVNINAAVVNGGGLPGGAAGRGGGGLVGGLKTGAAIAAPLLVGVAAVEVVNFEEMRTEARAGLGDILEAMPRRNAVEAQASIDRITAEINRERPLLDGILFNTNVRPQLEDQITELQALIDAGIAGNAIASEGVQSSGAEWARQHAQTLGINNRLTTAQQQTAADWDQQHRQQSVSHSLLSSTSAATKAAITTGSTGIMNRVNAEISATGAVKGAVATYGAAQLSKQAAIAAAVNTNTGVLKSKNFAPKIKVTTNVTSNVTISEIQRKITSQQIASSVATGGGGFAV